MKTSLIVEASPVKLHNRIRPESDKLGLPSRERLIVTSNLFKSFKLGRNYLDRAKKKFTLTYSPS